MKIHFFVFVIVIGTFTSCQKSSMSSSGSTPDGIIVTTTYNSNGSINTVDTISDFSYTNNVSSEDSSNNNLWSYGVLFGPTSNWQFSFTIKNRIQNTHYDSARTNRYYILGPSDYSLQIHGYSANDGILNITKTDYGDYWFSQNGNWVVSGEWNGNLLYSSTQKIKCRVQIMNVPFIKK